LKRVFVLPSSPLTVFNDETTKVPGRVDSRGLTTVYIPARMTDNIYLDQDYAGQFGGLPPEMARALIEGDWDAVAGAAYQVSRERHMLRPFTPPRHWTRFMALDWGTARPFSVGWYCVSEGAFLKGQGSWPDRWIPEGAVIRYAEWYGWNGRENEGCRLDSTKCASGILQRERDRGEPAMDYRVADYQMWAQTDGPSPAERFGNANCPLRQAKKDRKMAYWECTARLAGNPFVKDDGQIEEHPMFFVTQDCVHFWRTIPNLMLDETEPDKGPGNGQEDHVADEWSYALRSRPFVQTLDTRWEEETAQYRQFEKADFY
jgi:hypothetical protein